MVDHPVDQRQGDEVGADLLQNAGQGEQVQNQGGKQGHRDVASLYRQQDLLGRGFAAGWREQPIQVHFLTLFPLGPGCSSVTGLSGVLSDVDTIRTWPKLLTPAAGVQVMRAKA